MRSSHRRTPHLAVSLALGLAVSAAALSGPLGTAARAAGASDTDQERAARWREIATSIFGDRRIETTDTLVKLDTPARALDAALVPITLTMPEKDRINARAASSAGRYGLDDLLVERLLLGTEPLAARLAARLEPLLQRDPGGTLAATLRTYLASGSVPETARVHVIHQNTVAYRLARIATLTGLDARTGRDAAVLVLALTALEQAQEGRP